MQLDWLGTLDTLVFFLGICLSLQPFQDFIANSADNQLPQVLLPCWTFYTGSVCPPAVYTSENTNWSIVIIS